VRLSETVGRHGPPSLRMTLRALKVKLYVKLRLQHPFGLLKLNQLLKEENEDA
jgi:hypothetical protein